MQIPKNTPNNLLSLLLEDFTAFYKRCVSKLDDKIISRSRNNTQLNDQIN